MNEHDELRDRAARIAYEIEVQNYGGYDWEKAKADAGRDVGPLESAPPLYELDMAYEIADGIIALVEQDVAAHNAYLWEQAERPEFVKMVAKALEGMGDSDEWHDTPDERQLGNAEVAISNTLYFLLGPRKEATDG